MQITYVVHEASVVVLVKYAFLEQEKGVLFSWPVTGLKQLQEQSGEISF